MTIPMFPPAAAPAGELYYPTPVTPEEAFQAIGRLRKEAQDEIERLLAFLDETDGDPDLEPSLAGYSPGMDDREAEPEHEEDGGDAEPNVDDEPGADDEPRFGWNDEEAARGRYPSLMGAATDREG